MTRLYLALVLATEMAAIGLVSYHYASGLLALLLAPVPLLTLVGALFMGRRMRSLAYRIRRLSPEDIIRLSARSEERSTAGPEELSRSIVERAEEIRRMLAEGPSEVQVEMCALGYRACVNDMITLTNLITEEWRAAGPLKRLKLRRWRRRATDALSDARKALPPSALRATRQEL
jgi:hypothetical protein